MCTLPQMNLRLTPGAVHSPDGPSTEVTLRCTLADGHTEPHDFEEVTDDE